MINWITACCNAPISGLLFIFPLKLLANTRNMYKKYFSINIIILTVNRWKCRKSPKLVGRNSQAGQTKILQFLNCHHHFKWFIAIIIIIILFHHHHFLLLLPFVHCNSASGENYQGLGSWRDLGWFGPPGQHRSVTHAMCNAHCACVHSLMNSLHQ